MTTVCSHVSDVMFSTLRKICLLDASMTALLERVRFCPQKKTQCGNVLLCLACGVPLLRGQAPPS
jgi:hypothetical protein